MWPRTSAPTCAGMHPAYVSAWVRWMRVHRVEARMRTFSQERKARVMRQPTAPWDSNTRIVSQALGVDFVCQPVEYASRQSPPKTRLRARSVCVFSCCRALLAASESRPRARA